VRPEARGICHICHMVNPTLSQLNLPHGRTLNIKDSSFLLPTFCSLGSAVGPPCVCVCVCNLGRCLSNEMTFDTNV